MSSGPGVAIQEAATDRASRARRNREAKFSKRGHDPIVVPLRNKLPAGDPVVDDGVVFLQQSLELTKLLGTELRETLIGKGADQQIGLASAAVPGAEPELASDHLQRLAIVPHGQCGLIGYDAIWHGIWSVICPMT